MCELDYADPDALPELERLAGERDELLAAAWNIQGWIRSCFDVVGQCPLCGTANPGAHVNNCPWPEMRGLLDRLGPPER